MRRLFQTETMLKRASQFTPIILLVMGIFGCQAKIDPKNPGPAAQQAIKSHLKKIGGNPRGYKSISFRDLNGDDHLEAITLSNDPKLCTSEGCPLLIFENKNERYAFLSQIDQVKSIRGESKAKNGWKSLIVTSGAEEEKIYILPFDEGYPSQASQGKLRGGKFNKI